MILITLSVKNKGLILLSGSWHISLTACNDIVFLTKARKWRTIAYIYIYIYICVYIHMYVYIYIYIYILRLGESCRIENNCFRLDERCDARNCVDRTCDVKARACCTGEAIPWIWLIYGNFMVVSSATCVRSYFISLSTYFKIDQI